jgi:hypothetical protein
MEETFHKGSRFHNLSQEIRCDTPLEAKSVAQKPIIDLCCRVKNGFCGFLRKSKHDDKVLTSSPKIPARLPDLLHLLRIHRRALLQRHRGGLDGIRFRLDSVLVLAGRFFLQQRWT